MGVRGLGSEGGWVVGEVEENHHQGCLIMSGKCPFV